MSQFCANSSFFTSGRKFPASNENSKFNGNFKGILYVEVKAQALSLFFILTLRNLIPKVFGYEIEHFVLCIEDEHFVEHFAISPYSLHPVPAKQARALAMPSSAQHYCI